MFPLAAFVLGFLHKLSTNSLTYQWIIFCSEVILNQFRDQMMDTISMALVPRLNG